VEARNGFRLVNGDASKPADGEHELRDPQHRVDDGAVQDTTEMGRKVAEFANFWGGGESLVVQRLGI